jgi:methionine sulfoxide reductase catalytic subunit
MKDPEPITPPALYFNRRALLQAGAIAGTAAATAGLYRTLNGVSVDGPQTKKLEQVTAAPEGSVGGFRVQHEAQTPLADITHYNNFYEFSTDKGAVAKKAAGFVTDN